MTTSHERWQDWRIASGKARKQRWLGQQGTVLRLLGSGTLALLAMAMVVGDDADQAARAKGLMRVDGEPIFLGHHCMQEAEEEPEPPPDPPCPRAGEKGR